MRYLALALSGSIFAALFTLAGPAAQAQEGPKLRSISATVSSEAQEIYLSKKCGRNKRAIAGGLLVNDMSRLPEIEYSQAEGRRWTVRATISGGAEVEVTLLVKCAPARG